MLSIRKTKTTSGSTAVQIVYYKNRKVIVEKHLGSGKTKEEIEYLIIKGKQWINAHSRQEELFPPKNKKIVSLPDLEFLGVTHRFAYELFEKVALKIGLEIKKERLLFDFSIMRLIEPASKLRTIKLLARYFGIIYSERTVYRKILNIVKSKQTIETIAVKCAREKLQDHLALVLYDVTTLYFESFKKDELRIEGFSKDNKSQQPQIVVGLIVTRYGFPLSYEVFAGNTFEGKTMLSVLENFIKKNKVHNPIVVADAAMLSQANIEELQKLNLSYIVGARLGNAPRKTIEDSHNKLQNIDGKSIRIKAANSELIIEFSQKRYRKDRYEMDKQLRKAEQLVKDNQPGKRAKFVKHKNNMNDYILNETLIEKTKLLLGMKGYYTNIPATVLTNGDIITRYHDLWHIEQAFRMAKSDLASRPVFHYKKDAVKSHILICFTALIIGKFLEINTKLSLKQIIDALWIVTDAQMYEKSTNTIFNIQVNINQESKNVINKINRILSY